MSKKPIEDLIGEYVMEIHSPAFTAENLELTARLYEEIVQCIGHENAHNRINDMLNTYRMMTGTKEDPDHDQRSRFQRPHQRWQPYVYRKQYD